jgi:hypothetical protein
MGGEGERGVGDIVEGSHLLSEHCMLEILQGSKGKKLNFNIKY